MDHEQSFISTKTTTPSDPCYLSQIPMYLDTFLVLDTSVFAKGNMVGGSISFVGVTL
jgi:hypothetical protein